MAGKTKKLGRLLLESLRDVTSLMGATSDPDRLEELVEQRARLLEELGELVDKILTQSSEEYKAATAGLLEASAMIRKAIKGMESVAKAISAISRAVNLVSKVA